MANRNYLYLISITLIVLMTGCAKKPHPEQEPSPMTEAFLMKHTTIKYDEAKNIVTFRQYRLRQQSQYTEHNATVNTFLIANIPATLPKHDDVWDGEQFLIFFSVKDTKWGGFNAATDTVNGRRAVYPFTSNIRDGAYYENDYIYVNRSWLEQASKKMTTILLLGSDSDISINIPPVYPKALLHSLKAYREQTAKAAPKPEKTLP
jgi:hypothetical protein